MPLSWLSHRLAGTLYGDLTSGPGCGTPQLWPPGVSLAARVAGEWGKVVPPECSSCQLALGLGIQVQGQQGLKQKKPDPGLVGGGGAGAGPTSQPHAPVAIFLAPRNLQNSFPLTFPPKAKTIAMQTQRWG